MRVWGFRGLGFSDDVPYKPESNYEGPYSACRVWGLGYLARIPSRSQSRTRRRRGRSGAVESASRMPSDHLINYGVLGLRILVT